MDALADRFWSKVARAGDDDCWVWTAARWPNGYGKFSVAGRQVGAHRVSFALDRELGFDKLPPAVCHTCDNPPCVNPRHLFAGNRSINFKDMWAKGRGRPKPTGVLHPRARLTEEQVREIRASEGSSREVAPRFGVSAATIRDVRSGRRWSHVE